MVGATAEEVFFVGFFVKHPCLDSWVLIVVLQSHIISVVVFHEGVLQKVTCWWFHIACLESVVVLQSFQGGFMVHCFGKAQSLANEV